MMCLQILMDNPLELNDVFNIFIHPYFFGFKVKKKLEITLKTFIYLMHSQSDRQINFFVILRFHGNKKLLHGDHHSFKLFQYDSNRRENLNILTLT